MITVPEIVARFVSRTPFLEEGLTRGWLNLTAVARDLRPQVEAELFKEVKEGAIVMGLRRHAARLRPRKAVLGKVLRNLGDLTLRSGLVEFTFASSESLLDGQRQLLHVMARRRDSFVAFSQGVAEVTMIVSSAAAKDVTRLFANERLILRLDDLSAITIRLPAKVVTIPGVHYSILKQLAWCDINVVEVVSTYTELSIVLANADVDRAFVALKSFLWR
jgi:aspartokinase